LTACLLLTAGLTLAGCGAPDAGPSATAPPGGQPTSALPSSETASAPPTSRDRFFFVLSGTGLTTLQSEEQVYALGIETCRNLDEGSTPDAEVEAFASDPRLGDQGEEAGGRLVGAAAAHLCPKHKAAAQKYVDLN